MRYAAALFLTACCLEPIQMNWSPIPSLTDPSYNDLYIASIQKCVNWYPQRGKSGWVLQSAPGYTLHGTVGNNAAIRGLLSTEDIVYSVNGNKVYTVGGGGTMTEIGTVTGSSGFVRMAYNATQILLIESAVRGYIITRSTGATAIIADANFPSSVSACAVLDGYFVVNKNSTGQIYLSALNDGTDWTPVTFATEETRPDNVLGLATIGSHLWILSERTIVPWYNTGNASFPLARIPGAGLDFGIVSSGAGNSAMGYAVLGDQLLVLARKPSGSFCVIKIMGLQAQIVSTPDIDARIATDGASGYITYAYHENGNDFFELNRTDGSGTLVYDITENAWFEKASSGATSIPMLHIPDAVGSGTYLYAGNSTDGKIYKVDRRFYNDENGTALVRTRDFKIDSGMSRSFHAAIRFEFEAKHDSSATYTLSGVLSWSDDGGINFSSGVTMSASITSQGTNSQQVILTSHRLGSPKRERIYRLVLTGPSARLVLRRGEILMEKGRF